MARRSRRIDIPEDYNEYELTGGERMLAIAAMGALGAALAFVFYKNPIISALGLLLGLMGPKLQKRRKVAARKAELNNQFKDLLNALSSTMGVGISLKDAIPRARQDLAMLYPSEDAIILRELDHMIQRLELQVDPIKLFESLGSRSGNDDILSFASVLRGGQGRGIDLVELVRRTAHVLSEKMQVKQEIEVKVAAIKMDQKILLIMPVLIVGMMQLIAPDYMQALYDSPAGYVIITVGLALIGVSVWVSNKIMNIDL